MKGEDFSYNEIEITFNDKTKERFTWEVSFDAYYPELNVLLFRNEADGDYSVDLNDRNNVRGSSPVYYAVSPDRQLRINGDGPDAAARDGVEYFLEKWNPSRKKYELVGYFEGEHLTFYYSSGWFWMSNNKALFRDSWDDYTRSCYEIEIIKK